MKEIEVKARVRDPQNLEVKINELGIKLSDSIWQRDSVFVPADDTSIQSQRGRRILRIREQKDKTLLTLKIHQSNELESIEKELAVSDPATMREIIEALGFVQIIQVEKQRRKGKFNQYEICLDSVSDLGDYIEVEVMSTNDPEEVQAELWEFLESLGLTQEDKETRGYDTLVRLKNEGNV